MTARKYNRTLFGDELLTHARRWRARVEGGDGLASPMFANWLDGIFPSLRGEASSVVDAEGVRLHDYARAVVSSQAFAMNLFLPFRTTQARALGEVLSESLGRQLQVENLRLEYVPEGDILGEWVASAPSEDEARTAVDVWVEVIDDGGLRGVVLLEVKLSEGGFTPCGGRSSRGNRDHAPCESAAVLFAQPERCYLTRPFRATKDRRQWMILSREGDEAGLRGVYPNVPEHAACPFEKDGNQIMRNHALGAGMVQAGRADFFAFGLVHHDANPDVVASWDAYVSLLATGAPLVRIPASNLIAGLERTPEWSEWGSYMRARFALEDAPR